MSADRRRQAIGAVAIALAGVISGPAPMATASNDDPLPAYDYVRMAWQNGKQVALFIALSPPDNSCFERPADATSTFLIPAINPAQPQGTALTVDLGAPAGVVFGEPQHDDVLPDGRGGVDDASVACGYVLSPSPTAGDRVRSRPGHPQWGPARWAYAVRLREGDAFRPLNRHTTIVRAIELGLLQTTPIGSGGTAWTAPCANTGSRGQLVQGTDGNDILCSNSAGSVLVGGAGNDILVGGPGRDVLLAGPGDDVAIGGYGSDVLVGGPGADRLYGGWGYVPGADPATVFPPPDPTMPTDGNDVLLGGAGADYAFGGSGDDVLSDAGEGTLIGGFGTDFCSGVPGDC